MAALPDPEQIIRPSAAARAGKPEVEAKALAEIQGAALRSEVARGQPIVRGDMVKPGNREFLQVVLAPGSRAIALPLPAGIGFLSAGDRVDVILTQTFKGDAPLTRRSVSETVADDLRVLAIDPPTSPGARGLTLEVSPEQAEHINVAGELGRLSLTLRGGVTASGGPRPVRPTWAGDVSSALNGTAAPNPVPKPVATPSIDVIRGNHSEKVKSE